MTRFTLIQGSRGDLPHLSSSPELAPGAAAMDRHASIKAHS